MEKYLYAYINNYSIGLDQRIARSLLREGRKSSRSENVLVLIDKLSENILWDRIFGHVLIHVHRGETTVLRAFIHRTERDDKGIVGIHAGDVNGRGCRVTRS